MGNALKAHKAVVDDVAMSSVLQGDVIEQCRHPWILNIFLVVDDIRESRLSPIFHRSVAEQLANTSC
jgi:hypothetical protein